MANQKETIEKPIEKEISSGQEPEVEKIPETEIVSETPETKPRERPPVSEEETPSAPAPVSADEPETEEETKKIQNLDKKRQVKALTDLAFEKGLNHAIKVAKNLNDAFILDEFHDQLVDKFYKELLAKGKLKPR